MLKGPWVMGETYTICDPYLFTVAEWRPAYFTNVTILGALLLLEVVVVTVWHYERWFFAVMMLVFLWAGSTLPLAGAGSAAERPAGRGCHT